jgi:tubulin polyglutamylase TTLL9
VLWSDGCAAAADVHITNVAIQKKSTTYDAESGGKMHVRDLRLYLATKFGSERVNQLFCEMQLVCVRALLSVQNVIISDKQSFELYGYDLLIDADLKVWLLEVNACPSLTANTLSDYKLKFDMLSDMMTIVDFEKKYRYTYTDAHAHPGPHLLIALLLVVC